MIVSAPDLLFGVGRVEPVGEGDEVHGSMHVGPRHVGADGRTAVGGLGVLVDDVLGYSIIASLPPGSWTISTEIWVDVLTPLPEAGPLHGEAATIQRGSFATGQLRDPDGRVVVLCRERGREVTDPPDPTWRPELSAVGSQPTDAGLAAALGLELGVVSVLRVGPVLENPRRVLHGGASLAACEAVATWSRVQAGSTLPTSSLHIVHSRAVPLGANVELTATTVHGGRTLWVTDVVGTVAGKTCVAARVSAQ